MSYYKNASKNSESIFSRTNRNDRYQQMTKQQQLIEEKKRQIQEKLDEQKRKELEQAKLKALLDEQKLDKKQLVFSNDGSFLDQFRKLSGMQDKNSSVADVNVKRENSQNEEFTENRTSGDGVRVEDRDVKTGIGGPHVALRLGHPPPHPDPRHFLPFPVPPPPPPLIPPLMPPNVPPPIPPGTIPPPGPLNLQSIPPPSPGGLPPGLHIPPPPFPPGYPHPSMGHHFGQQPPPQLQPPQLQQQSLHLQQQPPPPPLQQPASHQQQQPPQLQQPPLQPNNCLRPQPNMPNLSLPPPVFSSSQVPADNTQDNVQEECFGKAPHLNQQEDSKDWFKQMDSKDSQSVGDHIFSIPALMDQQVKREFKTEVKTEPDHHKRSTKSGERKRKSRWSDDKEPILKTPILLQQNIHSAAPKINITGMSGTMLTKVTQADPGLLQYALTAYGSTALSEEDWKKAEENYKVHLLYQNMMAKRAEVEKLRDAGKNKYEYDSDEEIDEKGTWEHKLREKEMVATEQWAESLTEMAKGKHHIGDFLPPDELEKFMAKYQAVKGGGEPDLSDYKEYKLGEENKGFQMLQKLGWSEGQGLGSDGAGRLDPINKGKVRDSNEGLGLMRPDDVVTGDDEYDAYRKRMMLAYRFRPNPLNNPRRPYY